MTGLIKFTTARHDLSIRSLAPTAMGRFVGGAAESSESESLHPRLVELEQALAEKTAQIEALIEIGREAFAEGHAAGRAQGQEDAARERSELVAALERMAETALAGFSHELSSLERLAPRLAFEVMDRILGDPDHMREAAAKLIGRQLRSLEADAVVHIEVAEVDFPDENEMAQLRRKLGSDRLDLRSSTALESGGCRIKLQLGTLEIGLNQQWGHMADLLLTLAEAEA